MGRHEPAALSSWSSHLPGPRRTQQEPWSDGVPTLLGAQGIQVNSGELGAGHAATQMGRGRRGGGHRGRQQIPHRLSCASRMGQKRLTARLPSRGEGMDSYF